METVKNWWQLEHFSLISNCYLYVDVADYFADNILGLHHIRVKYMHELVSDELPFQFIVCRTNKKNAAEFETAMKELENQILICGYTDYLQFCNEFNYVINHGSAKNGAKFFGTGSVGGKDCEKRSPDLGKK